MNFKCFICNNESTEFTKQGISFEQHRKSEHNEWDYVLFLTHLNEISQSDLNGTESYVFDKISDSKDIDISWIPIGKAKCLKDQGDAGQESIELKFEEFIQEMEAEAILAKKPVEEDLFLFMEKQLEESNEYPN